MASPTSEKGKELPGLAEEMEGAESAGPNLEARGADFVQLAPQAGSQAISSLDHLLDVTVTVTAELGRVTIPIGEVLKLGIGSVLELHRSVSEPVDLMVQGVRVARGEVVVVDDRFAIRIKEITDPKRRPQA